MPPERAIPILIQVCGALHEAHDLGIVHRDLKPENIFLSKQGGINDFPKVLDFGLAKVTERQMQPGSVILTQEGMVLTLFLGGVCCAATPLFVLARSPVLAGPAG